MRCNICFCVGNILLSFFATDFVQRIHECLGLLGDKAFLCWCRDEMRKAIIYYGRRSGFFSHSFPGKFLSFVVV